LKCQDKAYVVPYPATYTAGETGVAREYDRSESMAMIMRGMLNALAS
jgi:hypothetical protein